MTLPAPAELKRRALEQQYDLLSRRHVAATQQLRTTLNAADRPQLEEQVADLETEIAKV